MRASHADSELLVGTGAAGTISACAEGRLGLDDVPGEDDHSQIVQLECLRSGIWGTKSLWGRVVTYKS